MTDRKTIVVALDKKSDVAAFLNFVEKQEEPCNIVFTSISLPCWTDNDSILTIGEVLNAYVYSITDVQHEVLGMVNWGNVDDLYYDMLREINSELDTYGFSAIDFVEITMRLLLRQKIAVSYDASSIIMGEERDDTKLSTNSGTINSINSLMHIKADIDFIDKQSTVVDEFIVAHDLSEYNSFREYRFDRAKFDNTKTKQYALYIVDKIKSFVDAVFAEDVVMGEIAP